jgi:rhodanese-related sulfurtransferase
MARDGERGFTTISPAEAERLFDENSVRVLDVRTPEEYRDLGHVPGAVLFPVDLIASAPATLPADGKPILIYCEHGIRSVTAARFLARAGFPSLLNLGGGLSRWTGPREFDAGEPFGPAGPSAWLVQNADLLPRGGRALDLACGKGRHALLLGAAGFPVRGVDRDPARIEFLRATAERLGLPVEADVIDLETAETDLGREVFDIILGFHYLHRPLFPVIFRALRPGGVLLYETFTVEQAGRGEPKNPDFLLRPGELLTLVAPLEVLRRREGDFEGRMISAVAARKV